MIAYRLAEAQGPPTLQDVPKPSPGAGEVLIKIGGCGLCHTDIVFMHRTQTEWFDRPPVLVRNLIGTSVTLAPR